LEIKKIFDEYIQSFNTTIINFKNNQITNPSMGQRQMIIPFVCAVSGIGKSKLFENLNCELITKDSDFSIIKSIYKGDKTKIIIRKLNITFGNGSKISKEENKKNLLTKRVIKKLTNINLTEIEKYDISPNLEKYFIHIKKYFEVKENELLFLFLPLDEFQETTFETFDNDKEKLLMNILNDTEKKIENLIKEKKENLIKEKKEIEEKNLIELIEKEKNLIEKKIFY
jgi:hypothetical protein